MTDLTVFREYEPFECGADGYPYVWHVNVLGPVVYGEQRTGVLDPLIELMARDGATHIDFQSGVKHLVRAAAGHQCVRCHHPFIVGESGEWGIAEGEEPPPAGVLSLLADEPDTERQMAARPPLWSPCTEDCEHAGPMRVWTRLPNGSEGWSPFDPTPEACGPAVAAVAPSPVQAAWRILTVHHLNGRKHDLRWWNLAALCQRCHLLIQRKVIMERIFPFEHTGWFKPYAAAWYAYAYLGENLTREQAVERQDELLALERMA